MIWFLRSFNLLWPLEVLSSSWLSGHLIKPSSYRQIEAEIECDKHSVHVISLAKECRSKSGKDKTLSAKSPARRERLRIWAISLLMAISEKRRNYLVKQKGSKATK